MAVGGLGGELALGDGVKYPSPNLDPPEPIRKTMMKRSLIISGHSPPSPAHAALLQTQGAVPCAAASLHHAAVRRFSFFRVLALGLALAGAGCSPRGPDALRRGDEALAAGRIAEAIPLLERAVADLPGNASAWNQLGLAYHAAGRNAEAQKAYLRALNDDRNFFDAHFNLGALEFEQRRWLEAERELRTYLGAEDNRTNAAAWRMLGNALLAGRQLDAAERALTAAAQLAPDDASTYNSLGLTLASKRRLKDAQARFIQAIRLDPQDSAARLNLAVVTQQAGDRRGALEHYRAYLALRAKGPEADEVQELVRQLEASLVAPPAIATNRVPLPSLVTPTAPPPALRVATNPVVTTPARATNPPVVATATVSPTNPPPKVPATTVAIVPTVTNPPVIRVAPPVTPPEVPVEIVRIEESPELKPARDVVPVVPPTTRPASTVSRTNTTSTTLAPAVAAPPPPLAETAAPAPAPTMIERTAAPTKTFWQRVSPVNWGNPVKWFRDSETTPPTNAQMAKVVEKPASSSPVPTPSRETSSPPVSPTPVARPIAPAPLSTVPSKPVVSRYPRHAAPVLSAGNRPAAEAQVRQAESTPDRDAALAAWQRAVQLDPSWGAAWMQTGRLALEGANTSVVLQAGEAATLLEPTSASAHQLFAAGLARAGYPKDAAEHLERAVTLAPGNAPAHLALAGIYARDLGEIELARPHYEKVLLLDPKHPQAGAIRVWLSNNP